MNTIIGYTESEVKMVTKLIKDLLNESIIEEPWRTNADSLWIVLPITKVPSKDRTYILFSEFKDKIVSVVLRVLRYRTHSIKSERANKTFSTDLFSGLDFEYFLAMSLSSSIGDSFSKMILFLIDVFSNVL